MKNKNVFYESAVFFDEKIGDWVPFSIGYFDTEELYELLDRDKRLVARRVLDISMMIDAAGRPNGARSSVKTLYGYDPTQRRYTKDEVTKAENLRLDDSVKMYLRAIGQVPLLTPSEEIFYARRYREGDLSAKERLIDANCASSFPSPRSS